MDSFFLVCFFFFCQDYGLVGYPKLEHDLNLSNIQPYHVENRLSQMHLSLADRYLGEPDYGLVGYRKLEHNLHVGRTKFYLNPSKQNPPDLCRQIVQVSNEKQNCFDAWV